MRKWLQWHSIRAHIVAPLWLRLRKDWRWRIVCRLDRSRQLCWSSLVDAALARPEADACDVRTPLDCRVSDCATTCGYAGGHTFHDHEGVHECRCYCGKFRFTAAEGADDRQAQR